MQSSTDKMRPIPKVPPIKCATINIMVITAVCSYNGSHLLAQLQGVVDLVPLVPAVEVGRHHRTERF
eukprot:COSAG06_NODE_10619_length_1647_cov_75.671189_1_plen_66_part_10